MSLTKYWKGPMTQVFMLLFNLSIVTPEGISRDEIVNVYSRHFETEHECQQFLDNWSSIIRLSLIHI